MRCFTQHREKTPSNFSVLILRQPEQIDLDEDFHLFFIYFIREEEIPPVIISLNKV